ncbi:hypothetical protein COT72_04460 [archaeon CG10_big_fil_rev_8_21_14_0_10_43_11]|nr:MAG: hypothetical protein COT72_04460 [archaeon CG10_big_fil_rev_8_21_14_0_10_43_11]
MTNRSDERKTLEKLVDTKNMSSQVPDWTAYENGWCKDPRDQTWIYIQNGKPLFGGYGKTELR